jgi:CheY-like chemotaxis protein
VDAWLPKHKTVLLVEDDPDIREGMADVLRDAGRSVVEAQDGREAFAKLNLLGRPCLILLDLLMPRMDGYESLEQLKQRPDAPQFPVLVLSAHANADAVQHYPGVIGTLRKPFQVKTLLSWVEALC